MNLYLVSLKEEGGNAVRDHYVLARNLNQAATKAKKKNPAILWHPSVLKIECLGKPIA